MRGAVAGVLLAAACAARAQDDVVGGAIRVEPTYEHLGVSWSLVGDDDHDSACRLRFRRLGTTTWRDALPLVRTHPGITGEGGTFPDNRFAGSAFFLDAETTYELELSLVDPDGGGETRIVTGTTATEMREPAAPRDVFVIPGAGGGSGTSADPYLGLQAAADAAQPGDVVHVASGTYAPFTLLTSGAPGAPIVFRGPVDPTRVIDESRWAIVDGAGTPRGVVQVGEYDRETHHVLIERFGIQGGEWGVDAQRTQFVTLRRCVLRDVSFGYYNRRDGGTESDQVISDCVISGRNAWPDTGIPPERAVDLRGTRNVIRHCRIDHFGDGASIQPFTSNDAMGNDVHGCDISFIVDDPIELDSATANVRAWGNRVVNGRMGVSLAPIYGGPAYVFRNEFFNLEISAYKMNREPSGLVVFQNTSLKLDDGTTSSIGWQNTLLRNDVLYGARYAFEEYQLVAGSVDDWDYDALGCPATPFAKWNGVRYQDLADLSANSGIESHAVAFDPADVVSAILPALYTDGAGVPDLHLVRGAPAIDAGLPLPNVDDPFVTDGRPDCGAHELGGPEPLTYGPRPRVVLVRELRVDPTCSDVANVLLSPRCASASDESGSVGHTRIDAETADGALEIPQPGPLRVRGGGATRGIALTFYEIEDARASPCSADPSLRVLRDATRAPADLVIRD